MTLFAILHHNIVLQDYGSVILYSIAKQHNRLHMSLSSVSDEPAWILAHPLIHLIWSGGLEDPHEVYTCQKTQLLHLHCKWEFSGIFLILYSKDDDDTVTFTNGFIIRSEHYSRIQCGEIMQESPLNECLVSVLSVDIVLIYVHDIGLVMSISLSCS